MKWLTIFLLLSLSVHAQVNECDIFIKNGKIIDGTGNSWYSGNIAVKNGKIVAIGRDINFTAKKNN